MTDADFMRLAIEKCREGMKAGQSPFGAVIARDGQVVLAAHNVVLQEVDSTAHAEVNAIRLACKKLNTIDLTGCTIYSTTEPCPMCFSAIHWARIGRIVYGTNISDADRAGFNELAISNFQLREMGQAKMEIVADMLREECAKLFAEYKGKLY